MRTASCELLVPDVNVLLSLAHRHKARLLSFDKRLSTLDPNASVAGVLPEL
jgi:hypothetical protein